jgi:CHAT domain-containing protein
MLFGSVPEVAGYEHLIVVRDGSLYLLPFDSLVNAEGKYVAETHVVGYAPSATSYYLLKQQLSRSRQSQRALFGVGGVPYEQSNLKPIGVNRGYDPSGFANLPSSKEELESAASAIPGGDNTLLLGQNATESAIKKANLDRYLILHFAVHGMANRKQPDSAALVVLSDPAEGEDGFLQASEIVHFHLRADLVVLSACETAVGPVQGEEGIATLSRAFFIAGANAVISTLWSIDDSASLLLMKRFYAHLGAGLPPSSALAFA